MSGHRFKVGEPAIYAVADVPEMLNMVGEFVVICHVDARAGQWFWGAKLRMDRDYIIQWGDDWVFHCSDYQLRKINPPTEPDAITRAAEEEISA